MQAKLVQIHICPLHCTITQGAFFVLQEGQIMASVPTDEAKVGKQILPISPGAPFLLKITIAITH